MKSRYLILIPIIILALFLIPLILLRNEVAQKADPVVFGHADPPLAPPNSSAGSEKPPIPGYTQVDPSPNGIGKIFMKREISRVMGHPGIGWLERTEREKEEAPSKAIALLDLTPDAVIADIGAGSGYYSFRIAPLLPQGKVIAVDIQPEMLAFLKTRSDELNFDNVQPHLGTIESIQLPANSLDAALMVDAYHEFSHPAEMLTSLHKALKPGGKIYLLEYRAEDPNVPIKPLHKMSELQARKEFEALGFTFIKNKPDLPWQHLLVFEKPQLPSLNSQITENILEILESMRIQKIDFEDATVEEAFDFLRQRMGELDDGVPVKRGISMVVRRPRNSSTSDDAFSSPLELSSPEAQRKLSLTLENVSFREALEAIAEEAALDIYITPRALLVTPAGSLTSPSSDPEILSTIYRHSDP